MSFPVLELVDTVHSGNGWKVRLLCGYLGRSVRRRSLSIVDGDLETEDFRRINPWGQVPVLRTAEGRWLAESGAILWYLAQGTAFLPAERLAQAQLVQWLSFEQTQHMVNLAQPRLWVHLRQTMQPDDPRVLAWRHHGEQALAHMERHLQSNRFFVGDGPSIADVALFPYTCMAAQGGYELQPYPQVRGWLARMQALPGYVPLL
ncbi:MAG TPA: glutathione S-transferase family protein [Alcaligenes sp.]|nr:glutathione S-transferase family protein [Alcaligenes sp.]HRL28013.1 glutathione S-transferase family protein [Alcaligenes sp.]